MFIYYKGSPLFFLPASSKCTIQLQNQKADLSDIHILVDGELLCEKGEEHIEYYRIITLKSMNFIKIGHF